MSAHTTEAFRKELEDRYNADLTKLREAVEATGYVTWVDVDVLRANASVLGWDDAGFKEWALGLADRLADLLPPRPQT